ncbi:MAG: FtsQ-type POTRA domain-containing protein, partial [Bacteroidetes bacterium]
SEKVLCNRIEVVLTDTLLSRFVSREDIYAFLENSEKKLVGYALSEINTRKLEQKLEENPYIRNAEVCKDISGTMEVRVEQRVPLVRIMPGGREGFYLDMEGSVLPLSGKFTPHSLLVTGHLHPPGEREENNLEQLFRFCSFLTGHPLWKGQIVQIYVDRNGEYELIPRVGAHHILLGGLEEWDRKLRNLELLYRQGLSRYGWNTYETINLKYTNQVICTKR